MTFRPLTKADVVDECPETEAWADKLRTEEDPPLAARVTRDYWWSVEYTWWDGRRWYGFVHNWNPDLHGRGDGGWEVTDVSAASESAFWGCLRKCADPDNPYALHLIPREDVPEDYAENAGGEPDV